MPVVDDEPMPAAEAPAIVGELITTPLPTAAPPPTLAQDPPAPALPLPMALLPAATPPAAPLSVAPPRVPPPSTAPMPAAPRFTPMAVGQPPIRPPHPVAEGDEGAAERTATAPQLRRFIKSRAYVPMHELRRRFGINGGDDDVTPVDLERTRVFVGLPEREGRLLGDLLRGGDIGYELSFDPITPIVIGVYPMRPVTRG